MSNELMLNKPAYLTQNSSAGNTTFMAPIGAGLSLPRLSFRGGAWRIISPDAEEEILKNDRNEPVRSIQIVPVAANNGIYKTWYAKAYTPGQEPDAPACWSSDGVTPAASSTSPQATACASCPQNQFGSRINPNGSKVKACTDNKRILVIAPDDLDGDLFTISMPVMTLKEWNAYLNTLSRHDVPVDGVITQVTIDATVEYAKLSFSFSGWLPDGGYDKIKARQADEVVAAFRGGETAPEAPKKPVAAAPAPAPAPAARAALAAAPAQAPVAAAPIPTTAPVAAAPAPTPAPAASVSPLRRGRKGAAAAAAPAPASAPAPLAPDAVDDALAGVMEGF